MYDEVINATIKFIVIVFLEIVKNKKQGNNFESVEEGETITFLDLMRRGIREKYQLGENDDE